MKTIMQISYATAVLMSLHSHINKMLKAHWTLNCSWLFMSFQANNNTG